MNHVLKRFNSNMSNIRLFYIHDPMCSWCYAFHSSLSAMRKELPSNIRMIDLLGGLAADTTEPMPMNLQNTIQQAWQQIEQTVPTVRFNYDFWSLNTPLRSTYPACRAILAARRQSIEFESKMLQAIQTAYYQQARNPSLPTTLEACAVEVGLDKAEFIKDLSSPEIEHALHSEIRLARRMDANSYPSLRLLHNEKQFSIVIDYLDHRTMIHEIIGILA